jgi:hypothetical protein
MKRSYKFVIRYKLMINLFPFVRLVGIHDCDLWVLEAPDIRAALDSFDRPEAPLLPSDFRGVVSSSDKSSSSSSPSGYLPSFFFLPHSLEDADGFAPLEVLVEVLD